MADLLIFSSGLAAVELWAFGEDELAHRMLDFEDDQMLRLWRRAAKINDPSFRLPVEGRRVVAAHVVAYTCMEHLEGEIRRLTRNRRRARKMLPPQFAAYQEESEAALSQLQMRLLHG